MFRSWRTACVCQCAMSSACTAHTGRTGKQPRCKLTPSSQILEAHATGMVECRLESSSWMSYLRLLSTWLLVVESCLDQQLISVMHRQEMERGGGWHAVDTEESMWCLEDDQDEHGEDVKTLMISLVRPPLTETEITWKKGELRAQPECLSQQGSGF